MTGLILRAVGVIATVAAIATSVDAGRSQEREDYNSGAYLYRAFCASCHGGDGTGKGPVTETLSRPVPDLTRLTRDAGGVFPRDRVLAILEGTKPIPGHSGSAMPRWSAVFKTLERDPRTAQKRLAALVEHIESLQVPDPR
jgi:mono/diheme cytochrome c family protein